MKQILKKVINYQPNIIKNMNSLMFTFSADQMCPQLESNSTEHQNSSKCKKRRPISSNSSKIQKMRIPYLIDNQLYENSHIQSCAVEYSPQENANTTKTINTSIQLQQKKKLRNIIDNMLGKNIDASTINKLDSIIISNKKNVSKDRAFLNQVRKMQQKQQIQDDKDSKQNYFNVQNINAKTVTQIEKLQNGRKKKSNILIKKFQFANIKINKINKLSQRYQNISKEQEIQPKNKQYVNMSRQSIDRENLGNKVFRSKTPKIMYPQNDSKLPSVFRTHKIKSSCGDSIKKRMARISSAHFISEFEDKKAEQSVLIQRKNTIQYAQQIDPLIRTKSRPQSIMLESKRHGILMQKNQNLFPKRLVFECNQDLSQGINKKLGQRHIETKSATLRTNTRAKSTHGNFLHRKLKQINNIANQPNMLPNQQGCFKKNQSHYSRQTAQQSNLQSSTDKSMINMSKIMEDRQIG